MSKGKRAVYETKTETVKRIFPIDDEPVIPTMDKPLIIESACPGFQVGGKRFPAVPITIKDQIKAQVESVKAGAILVHVHARNPKTGNKVADHRLLKEILDGIYDEVGDFVSMTHSWLGVRNSDFDFISGTQELLDLGNGNRYVQGSLIVPIGYRTTGTASYASAEATIEGIRWYEARGIKPIYQNFDTYSHLAFKRFLIDTGVSKSKPYVMNIQIGKHEAHAINKDPWSYLQLITNMNMIKENIPGSIIGIYPGGRNWLPMTTMGIVMGADIVRVGIEDCYWLYPHKNELIKRNADVVKMTAELARIHGRKVVTDAREARRLLGMRLT
jgi:3-keto-5-aminohexanoate cleavage enzyme